MLLLLLLLMFVVVVVVAKLPQFRDILYYLFGKYFWFEFCIVFSLNYIYLIYNVCSVERI